MNLTNPSMIGPATAVPIRVATSDEMFVAPTAATEKLYGGAEKICEMVMEIKTSQLMQVVKRSVAHRTIGDPSIRKGLNRVRQKDMWWT